MNRINAYIFRQLVWTTLFVAAVLTSVVLLTQSLRFVEMIVNRGLSAALFVYFTLLLLPTFLSLILPIAVFAAVAFTYNRLTVDSELVVLRSAGMSQAALAKPAIALAVLVMLALYSLTVYFLPTAYREFKDLQFMLRNSFSMVLLREGVFNTIMKGVTVYIRQRTSTDELLGIIVHDSRVPGKPVTLMAERGAIVAGKNGPRVVMVTGNRQEISEKDGRLSLLFFDRYVFDIGGTGETPGPRWREPRERYLNELFYPMAQEKTLWKFYKLRMEGHQRLALPLMAPAFALVALVFLLAGDFNRRGQTRRILAAAAVVVAMEVAFLGVKSLGEKAPWMTPLLYLTPLLPAAISGYMLVAWRGRRQRQWSSAGARGG